MIRESFVRLIHTADWQIGKVFRFVDQATMGVLQEARLEAISTIGRLATEHAAPTVLVAGDIYDVATAEDRTLAQPVARMRALAGVEWHLIPGNHDPHQPGGPWDRLLRRGLPANVRVHLEPTAVALADGAAQLLAAPLARRRTLADPTAWMDQALTPEGTIRIGLAHGSISAFGSDAGTQPNLIDPTRPERAGLAYLALGDWHGTKRIGPRCWYSGTPEVDDFGVVDGGYALLVELAAPDAPPEVTTVPTGRFHWRREDVHIHEGDVDVIVAHLRALPEEPACLLLDLHLEGTLSLSGRERLARALDDVGAALRFLRVDDGRLYLSPSADDIEAIARGGFVRVAAETLRAMADDPDDPARELAGRALLRLYVEHRKLSAP
jgi:DNA repair exonuclease SbcCD nuclease subunit